jgi:hypothetical protein
VRVPRHADLAFGFVLLLAIGLGGGSVATGLPRLLVSFCGFSWLRVFA